MHCHSRVAIILEPLVYINYMIFYKLYICFFSTCPLHFSRGKTWDGSPWGVFYWFDISIMFDFKLPCVKYIQLNVVISVCLGIGNIISCDLNLGFMFSRMIYRMQSGLAWVSAHPFFSWWSSFCSSEINNWYQWTMTLKTYFCVYF